MKVATFNRYVEQFGLPTIERQHRRGFRQFVVLWAAIFAVMAMVTSSNWFMGFNSTVWLSLNGVVVALFLGCAYQRYQLHRYIEQYRTSNKSR